MNTSGMRALGVPFAVSLLVACTGDPTGGATQGGATTGATTPGPETVRPGVLVDIRVGVHEGVERVTLEFAGDEVPEHFVSYGDAPLSDQCDEPDMAGEQFLTFGLPGMFDLATSDTVPGAFDADRAVSIPESRLVTEVVETCDFEGRAYVAVGLTGAYEFSISTLDRPGRLVVDVEP